MPWTWMVWGYHYFRKPPYVLVIVIPQTWSCTAVGKLNKGKKLTICKNSIANATKLFHRIEDMPFHPLHSSTGWWFQPLWKILVSWGYSSQYMGKNMFQTTNQSILMRFELDQLQHGLIITDDVRPRDVWNDSKVHMANLKYHALSLAGLFMYPAKLPFSKDDPETPVACFLGY